MDYAGDPASVAKRLHVPTYDEILERIGSRYPKGPRRPYEREIARLQLVRDVIISKTDFIRQLVRLLDSLHPFFWRLIEIEFDRKDIRDAISCIAKARKLVDRFWNKYRYVLMAAEDRRELRRMAAEARGRMLSPLKRCRRQLELLRSLVVFLSDLPAIDPSLPTVIVAGAPSTGKSTFVRSVTRAKPRVASYPFTTREVHVGHAIVDGVKVQVVDTPGILDRPLEEMNPVERRAAAALAELEGAVLFLVDPTEEAFMDVERQAKLASQVAEITGDKPIAVAVNKVDVVGEEKAGRVLDYVCSRTPRAAVCTTLVASDPARARAVLEDVARGLLARPGARERY